MIAQGWFCGSLPKGKVPSGSQSVQALRATRALRPPQNGLAWRDCDRHGAMRMHCTFECGCATVAESWFSLEAGRRVRAGAAVRFTHANAVRVAGLDRIIFCFSAASRQEKRAGLTVCCSQSAETISISAKPPFPSSDSLSVYDFVLKRPIPKARSPVARTTAPTYAR